MLFSLARRLRRNADTVMLVHATSYISLVYYTRTLSNTVEAFLFVALLYVTVTATLATRGLSPRKDRPDLGRRSIHDIDNVKTSGDDVGSPFVLALVLVAGFFKPPDFCVLCCRPMHELAAACWDHAASDPAEVFAYSAEFCRHSNCISGR